MALRYWGGGSYIDICAAFGAHPASLYRALRNVVDAVNSTPARRICACHPLSDKF